MNIQQYIKSLIENNSDYVLTPEDEKKILHEGIAKFIFDVLNSSKFRASATEEGYKKKIMDKIELCIMHKLPIHLSLPFGATKNPYLPTAPGVDWAEVFNIAYIREYLKPIAAAYEYGVILEYVSVAVFEDKVNRIPVKDAEVYDTQFQALIDVYQKYLPNNFQLKYSRVTDTLSKEKIDKALDIEIAKRRKEWDKQGSDVIEYKLMRAKRNSVFDPADQHSTELILQSALGHDAFCSECWTTDVAPWDKKDMIALGHNYTSGWAIHVRSTPGSSVNFWSGIGAVMKKDEKYIPTVLSPQQYKQKEESIKKESVAYFDKQLTNLQEVLLL